jgi:hypothetical protein
LPSEYTTKEALSTALLEAETGSLGMTYRHSI